MGLFIENDFRKTSGMPIVFLVNSQGETSIELIENKNNPYSGYGISIGFHVDNVIEYHEKMKNEGLNPTPIISPNPNVEFFFCKGS